MAQAARRMADAAAAFLDSLAETRAVAQVAFRDEAARRDWHYVPRQRGGLSFRDMTPAQEQLAFQLASSALSTGAFAQLTTIVALEDVLDRIEGGHRHRHRADYSATVFGSPGDPAWGFRFEGHHVSVNVTVVDGEVAPTPLFLGANPARVGRIAPLGPEESIARDLVDRLGDDAVISTDAPDDILTTAAPRLDAGNLPEPAGVRRADVAGNGEAASAFDALVDLYLARTDPPIQRLERGDIRFGWAGSRRQGEPHYYRLLGPRLLVEYDNTQNDANHVHTVVRDPEDDFGDDLLRRHLATGHP